MASSVSASTRSRRSLKDEPAKLVSVSPSSSGRTRSASKKTEKTAAAKSASAADVEEEKASRELYERSSNESFDSMKSDDEENSASRAECLKFATQLDELNLFVSE